MRDTIYSIIRRRIGRRPLVSVLLPTHNRADVLPFAIESILTQTHRNFELLIVGDGCTDDTARVVQSFRDRRIHWHDKPKAPNFGYANRNDVLRKARGDYIAYMAHDDLLLPDHLERCLQPLESQPQLEIVYTRPLWVTLEGYIIPLSYSLYDWVTFERFMSRSSNGIPSACVVHRRSCFEKYGYWNQELPSCADWDMWARIIEGGGRRNFAFLPEPTSLHFRANWRTDANAGPPELMIWRRFYKRTPGLPDILKQAVSEGTVQQKAFWERISPNPALWTGQVRWAVTHALDLRVAEADRQSEP